MPVLSLPVSVRFCRTRAARDAAAVAVPVVGMKGHVALCDWWAIGYPVKWCGGYQGRYSGEKEALIRLHGPGGKAAVRVQARSREEMGKKAWTIRWMIDISPVTCLKPCSGFPCAPPPEEQCSSPAVQASHLALDSPFPSTSYLMPLGTLWRLFRATLGSDKFSVLPLLLPSSRPPSSLLGYRNRQLGLGSLPAPGSSRLLSAPHSTALDRRP